MLEVAVTLPHRLIAPVRIADLSKPITISLPGMVHQVLAGHALRLVVAGGDAAYRGNDVAHDVTIGTGPGAAASTLSVPLLQASGGPAGSGTAQGARNTSSNTSAQAAPATGSIVTGSSRASGALASTGLDAAVPLAAVLLLGGGYVLRRRTRYRARAAPAG